MPNCLPSNSPLNSDLSLSLSLSLSNSISLSLSLSLSRSRVLSNQSNTDIPHKYYNQLFEIDSCVSTYIFSFEVKVLLTSGIIVLNSNVKQIQTVSFVTSRCNYL